MPYFDTMHGFVLVAASKSNHGGVKVSLMVKTMLIRGYTKVLL